jgi:hypothetical protein
MPKGKVGTAVAEIESRKRGLAESGSQPRKLFFRLGDGHSAVVRFLEESSDLNWAWVHQLPATGQNKFGVKIPCRDQGEEGEPIGEPCPGCERGDKRTFQGAINIIWRDAPVLQRDESNRIVRDAAGAPVVSGNKDSIAVWISGVTVFEDLEEMDKTYTGLSSRDFLVKRRGSGLNTRYTISPADPDGGPQKMSKADTALAAEKYDLTEYVVPPPFSTWGKANWQTTTTDNGTTTTRPSDTSPFKRDN